MVGAEYLFVKPWRRVEAVTAMAAIMMAVTIMVATSTACGPRWSV
jgi:hypothetical protein